MGMVVMHQPGTQSSVGHRLQPGIQARVDDQAALRRLVLAETVDQVAPHLLAEPFAAGHGRRRPVGVGHQRFGMAGVRVGLADRVGLHHTVQHPVAAGLGSIGEAERVVVGRRFRHRGQHRRLGDREPVQRLVEIGLCGGDDAIRVLTQIGLVQVQLENALLGQHVLKPQCQQGLFDLAVVVQRVRPQHHVARDLLGDGRSADRAAGGANALQVGHRGARDREGVDALVTIEILVFGGDEGELHALRNGGDGREDASLGGELGHQMVVAVIDAAEHRRLVGAQAIQCRQIGRVTIVDAPDDQAAGRDAHDEDRAHQPEQPAHESQHGMGAAFFRRLRLLRFRRHNQPFAVHVHDRSKTLLLSGLVDLHAGGRASATWMLRASTRDGRPVRGRRNSHRWPGGLHWPTSHDGPTVATRLRRAGWT